MSAVLGLLLFYARDHRADEQSEESSADAVDAANTTTTTITFTTNTGTNNSNTSTSTSTHTPASSGANAAEASTEMSAGSLHQALSAWAIGLHFEFIQLFRQKSTAAVKTTIKQVLFSVFSFLFFSLCFCFVFLVLRCLIGD